MARPASSSSSTASASASASASAKGTGAASNPASGTASTRPARRSHAQRREESERRMLDAALAIVAQRGTVRMTLAEVGEAAGYSRGLPAHHFGSKAGLVHALAGYIGERFGEQRSRGTRPAPGLAAIVGNVRFYFSRRGGAWTATRALMVMMSEVCMAPTDGHATTAAGNSLRHEVAAYNRSALAWFEQHIRAGIAQGEISASNEPTVTAVILLGAMRGVMQQWLVDERIPLPAVRDRLLQVVAQVLRAA